MCYPCLPRDAMLSCVFVMPLFFELDHQLHILNLLPISIVSCPEGSNIVSSVDRLLCKSSASVSPKYGVCPCVLNIISSSSKKD